MRICGDLRGPIPSFIMAYGDGHLTLRNFDEYTEADVFEEVTGITEDDFRFLRDGGEYTNPETGKKEYFMHILIIEDDRELSSALKQQLQERNHYVTCCHNGSEALYCAMNGVYDLILLDRMLPEIDGYELLEYVKPMGTPVIFLTAKGSVDDRIKGLKLGADDYIVKPFQVGELTARVEAVLRRYNKAEQHLTAGDVTVDVDARRVTKAGRPVELTNKEFGLLLLFMKNRNVALFRETLYEKVWEGEYFADSRTLDLHVQRLRKKLGWEHSLVAVYKVGYRLEVQE